jgi:flagellar biogenesis protein FliO
MIRVVLLFSLTFTLLNASKIINQTVYEKENRVDIMLSFDTPYDGKISQKRDKTDIILMLKDAKILKDTQRKIISPIIQKMQILPYADGLLIKLSSDEAFEVKASKTVDNYGLRLRVSPQQIVSLDESLVIDEEPKNFKTKKDDEIGSSYVKMIFTLLGLLVFLYFLKRWFLSRNSQVGSSWLFDKKSPNQNQKHDGIKILQQRGIDHKNRVALISFEGKKYLVLLGEGNILLDKFDDDLTSSAFDQHLDENEKALNAFISGENKKLDAYKDRASKGV